MADLLQQSEELIRELVENRRWTLSNVGPVYGRKTMTGLLRAHGVQVSKVRVGTSLRRVGPVSHQARRTTTSRQLNPVPYKADYFGHKLHIDQNEKVVMFGITHVCGYSGKIVGFITSPIKNCIEIYSHLFRPIVSEYGLWDQLRVDQGKEWYLMLFVQEQLAHLRYNTTRAPHLQTTSKLNHCVERIWVEINSRVNYPIKSCLVSLQEKGEIVMDDEHTKFCVSWFSLRVATVGTKLAVSSWNEHSVPRLGIANQRMYEHNHVVPVDEAILPQPTVAVRQMEATGSHLTHFSPFGQDPLKSHTDLFQRRQDYVCCSISKF